MKSSAPEVVVDEAPIFSFVKLIVADLEAAVSFYVNTFGFVDAQRLHFSSVDEAILRSPKSLALVLLEYLDGRPRSSEGREAPIGFRVKDVDAAYAKALEQGAIGTRPPTDFAHGQRAAFVKDPWDNEIEFVS